MYSLCSENSSVSGKRKRLIITKLVDGQNASNQLQILSNEPSLSPHHHLLAIIHRSFTETLSLLTSNSSAQTKSPAADGSGECRTRSTPITNSGGRGCYKRRRSAQSWTIVSPIVDDHHAWRKYGQKDIMNSKFPRSYFRCARKYDEGCCATKQVQQTQENPEMYQTIYIGIHTCKPNIPIMPANSSHLVMDSNNSSLVKDSHHPGDHSKVLHVEDYPPTPIMKQEHSKEDMTATSSPKDFQMLDSTLWSDFEGF